MITFTGQARAEHARPNRNPSRPGRRFPFKHEDRRPLSHQQSVALLVERPAYFGGHYPQTHEANKGQLAESVGAAGQRHIAPTIEKMSPRQGDGHVASGTRPV